MFIDGDGFARDTCGQWRSARGRLAYVNKRHSLETVVGECKLDADQLAGAWLRLKGGDKSAEQDIVSHHIGIVRFLLGRYTTGRHYDACESAALESLLVAVRTFNPMRGTKFSTYAWHLVKSAIRACLYYEYRLRRYNQVIRVGLDREYFQSDDGDEPVAPPERPRPEPDLVEKTGAAIENLPRKLRLAAEMRFVQGKPFQAIATALKRKSRGSGFHMVRRAAHTLKPVLADHEPGRENMLSKRKVRELVEDYKMRLAEQEAKEKPKMKRRAHHPDSCPQCGHTHRGQIDVGLGHLKCKRCGYVHKAKTQEGKP